MKGLAALIVLTLLAGGAAEARTLVRNANGYTLDGSGKLLRFKGLLIDDAGRVERLLTDGEAPALGGDDFTVDAGGRTLLPGLIDAHGHVMGLGFQALRVDLSDSKSLDEALAKVRAYAAANPQARWIVGRGWNQVSWGLGRFPSAAELDRAVPDRPVWLSRVDGHAGWANSKALQAAGITAKTADPSGGRIERGPDGRPSGVLVDAAMVLVDKHVPPPTPAEAEAALEQALGLMVSVGLTGVHDAGVEPEAWALYRRFAEEGRLTARIYGMAAGAEALDRIAPDGAIGWSFGDRLAMRAVKLYADGALGSRGAALKAPYSDDPHNKGLRFLDDAALRALVGRIAGRGFQVNVHAIGDAANSQVLNSFAALDAASRERLRHRIEHAQVVDPAELPRFAQLRVIASVQPTHATSDKAMAEDRIGPQRLTGAYAWRTLLQSGARIAAGSDFPVEPASPFFGLHAAVTRQDRDGNPPGGWHAEQAMTRTEALAGFTTDAAFAGHAEDLVGTLEPGKWADFILVDRDIFAVAPGEIWKTQVQETWLAGKRVYRR